MNIQKEKSVMSHIYIVIHESYIFLQITNICKKCQMTYEPARVVLLFFSSYQQTILNSGHQLEILCLWQTCTGGSHASGL